MKMIRLVLITGLALFFADDLKPIGASAAPQKNSSSLRDRRRAAHRTLSRITLSGVMKLVRSEDVENTIRRYSPDKILSFPTRKRLARLDATSSLPEEQKDYS